MELHDRNRNNSAFGQFKSSLDMAMGVLYMAIPIYAMQTQFIIAEYGKTTVYTIAALFMAYGLFRIFRGLMFYKNPRN